MSLLDDAGDIIYVSGSVFDTETVIIVEDQSLAGVQSVNGQAGHVIIDTGNFITGVDLSHLYPRSNPSGFITGLDLSSYATVSNLALTGSNLQSQIDNLDLNYASQNEINTLSGNLELTGQNLQQQIQNLNNSGFITGIDLSYVYTKDNPSGYITGVDLSSYVTKISGQFLDRPTVNGTGILLSGDIVGGGTANFRYSPVSGTTNLLSNNRYSFDTLTGLVTGVLPANPQKGDEIELYDGAGTWHINPLIIDNNGNYIEQRKDKLECNVRHGLIKLIYTTQNNIGWRIYPMPIHNIPLFLPPIPAISTSSISGFAPLTLSFTGVNLQTPAEFSPVDHWYWNVSGDSAPEFDQSVITYTFNETGNYTFYLTAVNAGGSGVASGTFSILEVPPITTGADPYLDYVTLLLHFNP